MTQGPDIIWLASYPKCGNTWLRFLLASYFFGPPKSSVEVGERVPDMHKTVEIPVASGHDLGLGVTTPGQRVVFAKTHFMASHRHPHWGQTAAAIVVTRNPSDVLLSNLNYMRLGTGNDSSDITDEQYARIFVKLGGDPRWRDIGFGTLDQHLASWQSITSFPRAAIRYEDLKADTIGTLRRVISFLRPKDGVDEARLALAVQSSTFERMRELEVSEKSAGKSTIFEGNAARARRGETFVRSGRVAQGLSHIAADLDHLCEQRFAHFMDHVGYERRFTSSVRSPNAQSA